MGSNLDAKAGHRHCKLDQWSVLQSLACVSICLWRWVRQPRVFHLYKLYEQRTLHSHIQLRLWCLLDLSVSRPSLIATIGVGRRTNLGMSCWHHVTIETCHNELCRYTIVCAYLDMALLLNGNQSGFNCSYFRYRR